MYYTYKRCHINIYHKKRLQDTSNLQIGRKWPEMFDTNYKTKKLQNYKHRATKLQSKIEPLP